MSKIKQNCGNCTWLDAPSDKRMGRDKVFPCVWPEPARTLPDSITKSYNYQSKFNRGYRHRSDGETCPTFELIGSR